MPTEAKIIEIVNILRPDGDKQNPYQDNVHRSQKILEFKELRSGKDQAYLLWRTIKFREWGQRSAEHLINTSVDDNSFVTAYDYDIKALFVLSIGCVLLTLKNKSIA